MALRSAAWPLVGLVLVSSSCGSRSASDTATGTAPEAPPHAIDAAAIQTAPQLPDAGALTGAPPDAAPAPALPPAAESVALAPSSEDDLDDDPCAAPPRRPTRLTLNKDTPHKVLGARIIFTGSGHKILAEEAPDGSLHRAGDMAFHEIEVTYKGETEGSRRMNDEWTEWAEVLGFCWRGVGKGAWRPEAIEIEIYRSPRPPA